LKEEFLFSSSPVRAFQAEKALLQIFAPENGFPFDLVPCRPEESEVELGRLYYCGRTFKLEFIPLDTSSTIPLPRNANASKVNVRKVLRIKIVS
jgi:hypothetical protein